MLLTLFSEVHLLILNQFRYLLHWKMLKEKIKKNTESHAKREKRHKNKLNWFNNECTRNKKNGLDIILIITRQRERKKVRTFQLFYLFHK